MRPETAAAIFDMDRAADRIAEATAGKTLSDYEADWYFQSAVERQFEILGEALVRVRDKERAIYDRIPDSEKIVGLRNIVIHAYDTIDPAILWAIATERLTDLRVILGDLLDEAQRQGL